MPIRSCLRIAVRDLLYQRGVEGSRIEFKRSWNEGPTADQVLRTICAFANDVQNLGGGYIVLGVGEEGGAAVLPPTGLDPQQLERIQKTITGLCRHRLDPEYLPILSHEVMDDRHLLVVWVQGSESRPHRAQPSRSSKERKYFIRQGAETVEAKGQALKDLLRMTGPPFDDRPNRSFRVSDLRATLVREFLRETGSALLDWRDDLAIYRHLKLSSRINDHEVPRNVGLMFFSEDPEAAFPGARIEVAEVVDGGDVLDEHTFRGPFLRQARDCLSFLRNRTAEHIRKVPHRAESEVWESYPFSALEETVVNALYHRGYEQDAPEPTKIYIYTDRIAITSYPGPVSGIEPVHFQEGHQPPQVPARNRRIGELFKETKMAELRGTGVTKIRRAMAANGSPPPRFEFDRERTYFTVVLPVHPDVPVHAPGPVPESAAAAGADGLILVSIGGESVRPVVERSLRDLGLGGAKFLVDIEVTDYLEADTEHLETEAKRLRNEVRKQVERPGIERLHLFYRGPVALAPLFGALAASSAKPLRVYHYEQGRYVPAYTLDRRFLIAKD